MVRSIPDEKLADDVFTAAELASMETALIQDFSDQSRSISQRFLLRDFVRSYVLALDAVIHPSWYMACFVANPINASMWSTYGDSHRGICLIF
jgi:hypothetical protein